MKVLDLFSGIGGFSLGLESTGYFKTIAFVEKDKFCRQVLQKNFNNIPIEEDIRNVRGSNYAADVVTGGFPCQPFSVAGKRKGTADDRYLWDETIRVVAECKPKWFIGENVEGLININNGMVLRQVQTDLEDQGFQVQCLVIPASGIGAWHQRKRIWIVGYSEHNGHTSTKIKESSNQTNDNRKEGEYQTLKSEGTGRYGNNENVRMDVPNSQSISGYDGEYGNDSKKKQVQFKIRGEDSYTNVSNSNGRMCGGRGTEFQSRDDREWWFYSEKEKQTKKSNGQNFCSREFNSTETIKTWWQTQSEFCGVPNGVSYELDKDRSNRIKALGNSIVPQIARQIGLSIIAAEQL